MNPVKPTTQCTFAELLLPVRAQSVQRMQQVIELGRVIRDQKKKPLKVPLRSMVVVHTEPSFLQDMAGAWPPPH